MSDRAGVGLVVLGTVVLALGVGEPVVGQEVAPLASPVVVDPAACAVEPRPVREIVALVGTAVPGQSTSPAPAATPRSTAPEEGEPADPETAAAVAAALVELAACTDRGVFARAHALVTDADLREKVGPLTEEHVALLEGVGYPQAGERQRSVLTVGEVRTPADGRVRAVARIDVGGEAPLGRAFVFRRIGERWLLDEARDLGGVATPTR
jgi:hypothetical protein